MINILAKSLVLVHVCLSLVGLGWALVIFLEARDLGQTEPFKEFLEYNTDGTPKAASLVRYASEYDKSWAAAQETARTRNQVYAHVKPALDSIRVTEEFMPKNHLYYRGQLNRLKDVRSDEEKKDPFKVFRFVDAGRTLVPKDPADLGVPAFEDKEIDMIKKPSKEYQVDQKKVLDDIDVVELEIRKIATETKKITGELTGTDEAGVKIGYGLYQLIDLEFKYQAQIKVESDELKPHWSKAIEQSRLYGYRRADLEATLEKLKALKAEPKKK